MKKSMRATFLMVLMFYSGTLCAGALMETAGKKLEQAREIGKFAKSIVDAKQDELNSLLQEKAALEEQEKEFAKTTKVAIEEVKNQLAELEKALKVDADKEFLQKKQAIFSEKYDVLLDTQRAFEGLLRKTGELIGLLERYLKDPDLKTYRAELKIHGGPYSFEDLEDIQQRIINQRKLVDQLKKRKETIQKDQKNIKQLVDTRLDEVREKQKGQEEFRKTGAEAPGLAEFLGLTVQEKAELLDFELKLAQDKKELAMLQAKEKQQEAALVEADLLGEKARQDILENVLRTTKASIVVTTEHIEAAKEDVEKKKQAFSSLKIKYNDEINKLKRLRSQKEEKLKELSIQYGIPVGIELHEWGWEPKKIVSFYVGHSAVGSLDTQVLLLQTQENQIETQINIEQEKVAYAESFHDIKQTYQKIMIRKFFAEEDITQELKKYNELRSSLESKIKNYTAKKDEIESLLLKLQNEVIERVKKRRKEIQEQRNILFKGYQTDYVACLHDLEKAEEYIANRMEALGAIAKTYTESMAIVQKLLDHTKYILGELESITIWYRPSYAISWEGLQNIVPDIELFLSDVRTYLVQFDAGTFIAKVQNTFRPVSGIALLLKFFVLLCFLALMRIYLPRVSAALLNAGKEHAGARVLMVFSAMLSGFIITYFISISLWVSLFVFLKMYVIPDPYFYILFYLFSILYLIYLSNRFMRYFMYFNVRNGYIFLAEDFQRRFMIILSTLLYATIAIVFFRQAFILARYHKSELPTILLAINFIIFQISLIFLISKEQILSIIPSKPEAWAWVRNLVDRFFYLILFVVIAVIVMSNPYVGYGKLVLYILTSLIYTAILLKLVLWGHGLFKQGASRIFFSSQEEVVRERFSYAKTWFGLCILGSFILFGFLAFILGARIWGWQIDVNLESWIKYPIIGKDLEHPISLGSILQIVGFILAGFFIAFAFNRYVLEKIFDLMFVDVGLQHAITNITSYLVVIAAILLGFQSAKLGGLITYLLLLIFSIGYIIKEPIGDLIAYFIILVQRPIKIGDYIRINDEVMGVVRKITPKSVVLRRKLSTTIVVPNSHVISQAIVNWNYTRNFFAFDDILVTINYTENPANVKKLLMEVVDAHPNVLKNPKPVIRLDLFGEYGYIFIVRGFLSSVYTLDQWDIASDIRIAIVERLRRENISIAVPVRLITSPTKLNAEEGALIGPKKD